MSYPAPVVEAVSQAVRTSGNTTLPINKPSGTVEGDLLVAVIYNRQGPGTFTPPSGWTEIASGYLVSFGVSWGYFYKAATASEPSSYTWTDGYAGTTWAGCILRISGADAAAPVGASTATMVAGGRTFATSFGPLQRRNSLLVYGLVKAVWPEYGLNTPAGLVQRFDQSISSGGSGFRGYAHTVSGGGTGSTHGLAWVIGTNTETNGYQVRGGAIEIRGPSTRQWRVRDAGVWKAPNPLMVMDAGIWKEPEQVAVRDANVWKEVYA